MNIVNLLGRLTRDPEIRVSQSGVKSARYTLAVNRPKDKDGNQQADFINCVTFGNRADFAEKYLQKGRQIAVVGRIQTGSYTNQQGQKVYTTDVIVNEHYFADSARNQGTSGENNVPTQQQRQSYQQPAPPQPQPRQTQARIDDYDFVPDYEDQDLPF